MSNTLKPFHTAGLLRSVGGSGHTHFINYTFRNTNQGFGYSSVPELQVGVDHTTFENSTYQMWEPVNLGYLWGIDFAGSPNYFEVYKIKTVDGSRTTHRINLSGTAAGFFCMASSATSYLYVIYQDYYGGSYHKQIAIIDGNGNVKQTIPLVGFVNPMRAVIGRDGKLWFFDWTGVAVASYLCVLESNGTISKYSIGAWPNGIRELVAGISTFHTGADRSVIIIQGDPATSWTALGFFTSTRTSTPINAYSGISPAAPVAQRFNGALCAGKVDNEERIYLILPGYILILDDLTFTFRQYTTEVVGPMMRIRRACVAPDNCIYAVGATQQGASYYGTISRCKLGTGGGVTFIYSVYSDTANLDNFFTGPDGNVWLNLFITSTLHRITYDGSTLQTTEMGNGYEGVVPSMNTPTPTPRQRSTSFLTMVPAVRRSSVSFLTHIGTLNQKSFSFDTGIMQPTSGTFSGSFQTSIPQPIEGNISASFDTGVVVQETLTHSFSFRTEIPHARTCSTSFDTQVQIYGADHISCSFKTSISTVGNPSHSFNTRLSVVGNPSHSFCTDALHYDPMPVQSVINPSNPLLPTLLNPDDGFIATNPITNPGINPAQTPYAMGYSLKKITSLDTCDIIEWSVNMDRTGGRFSVFVKADDVTPPDVFSPFTICGLPGTVMMVGPVCGSRRGYYIDGILGNATDLDKELVLRAPGTVVDQLINNGNIQLVPAYRWQTLRSAAIGVAHAAGMSNITWLGKDLPLTDAFVQTGMTARAAIESLASRVGARLFWAGHNNWVIATPNKGFGTWEGYPHCSVIKNISGPFKHGNYGHRAAIIPAKIDPSSEGSGFVGTVTEVPLFMYDPRYRETVIQLTSFAVLPDAGQPPVYIDLPTDFNKEIHSIRNLTRVQALVNPADVGPTYTTADQTEWFSIGIPVVRDKSGKQKLMISRGLFPTETKSKQFNIGYVPDQAAKNEAIASWNNEEQLRQQLQNALNWATLSYYPLKTATVESIFFNSVPLPGNVVTINYDLVVNWTALVESVSIRGNKSGADMTVSLTQWKKVNVAWPLWEIDGKHIEGAPPF